MSSNESRNARRMTEEDVSSAEAGDDSWVETLRRERLRRSVRNPGLAALMSFCVMGLGQIYAGHIDRGIILMMMHLATALSGYSLYTRGFLYDMVKPHFGPAAIVAVAYVSGVVIILTWIYNIKDAYYRSLFSGLRDWFEVERVLIPHLRDGGASHLLGAPVPPRARLTGPSSVRAEAGDEADEATVIEVARQENAAVSTSAGRTSEEPGDAAPSKELPRKKRARRTSDKPAAAMADALEEATGVGRNWRFTFGLLVIFLLVGIWMFNRQDWNLEDLRPSVTLFSINTDTASSTEAGLAHSGVNRRMEMRRAVAFLETGSITAAIGAFEEIVKRPDAPVEAWKGLLRSYHRDEQMGAYEDALVRYLKAFPDDADEWVTLGKLQYDRRAYVEASRSMLKCLAKDPAHLRGNYMMGAIYRELGLAEDAVPHLRKAQAGDPLNPEFNRELGAAFLETHDLKNARRHLEKALSIDQQDEVTQRLLEDVDAEERRSGVGIAGGAGYGAAPWAAAAPFSPGPGMEQTMPPAPVPAPGAAQPAPTSPAPIPAPAQLAAVGGAMITPPDEGGSRGRGVVLYVAPGLKGGQALPDLPDTLLRTGTPVPKQGPWPTDQSSMFAGLSNPTPEMLNPKKSSAPVQDKPVDGVPPRTATGTTEKQPAPGPDVAVPKDLAPTADQASGPAPATLPDVPEPEAVSNVPSKPPAEPVKEAPRAEPKTPAKVVPPAEPQKKKTPEPEKSQEDQLANTEALPAASMSASRQPAEPQIPGISGDVKKTAEAGHDGASDVSPLEKQRARGVNAYLRGRWEEALPQLLGYLKKKEDPHVYEMVGLIFQKLGSPDDAYEASTRAAQLGLCEPAFTARLGLMAAGLGKWDDGTRHLNEALRQLPHRIDLRLHLARCLRNTGQTEAARLELEKVLNEPNQTYAVRRRAEQEMEQLGIRIHPVGPSKKAPVPGNSAEAAAPREQMKPARPKDAVASAPVPAKPSSSRASGSGQAIAPVKPAVPKAQAPGRPGPATASSAVPRTAVTITAPKTPTKAGIATPSENVRYPRTVPEKKALYRSEAAKTALGAVLLQKPLMFGKSTGATASDTGSSVETSPDGGVPSRW